MERGILGRGRQGWIHDNNERHSQVVRKACELFCRNSRNTCVRVAVCMGKSTMLNRIFKNEIRFLTGMFLKVCIRHN